MESEDFLRDVEPSKVFWCHTGISMRNVYELVKEMKNLDEAGFKKHCSKDHDDFANWIGGAIGDIELSEKLRKIKNKKEYIETIEKRITELEAQRVRHELRKIFADKFRFSIHGIRYWAKIMLAVIIIALLIVTIRIQYLTVSGLKDMNNRINTIESTSSCFYSYYNDRLEEESFAVQSKNNSFMQSYCILNESEELKIEDDVLENIPPSIPYDSISIEENRVILHVNDTFTSTFSASSSMLPVLNHNSKAIEIKPKSADEIQIGNIISFRDSGEIIIHRVIAKNIDENGVYFITKGDNNGVSDSKKVRFEDINGKVVAIIY